MARLNIIGFETGDFSEVVATAGAATMTIDSAVKRTGAYSFKVVSSANFGYARITGLAADGTAADFNTANIYIRFYLYVSSLPASGSVDIIRVLQNSGARFMVGVALSSTGTLQLTYWNGSDAETNIGSASSALSTGQWYRVEIKGTSLATAAGATVELKLDGSVVATGTSLTVCSVQVNAGEFRLGTQASNTSTIQYDDIAIDDAAYPGAGEVHILKPNAAGSFSNWAAGTGSTFAEVDEVPHDSNTTYIAISTTASYSTFNMESAATGGISGTIFAVKTVAIAKRIGTSTGLVVRLRNNTTNRDTSAVIMTTSYAAYCRLDATDPDGGGAWTAGGVDTIECGVATHVQLSEGRVTAIYAMVECSGSVTTQVTPSTLSLTTSLQTPTVLTPQYARPASLTNTITLQTPSAILTQPFTPGTLSLVTATFAPAVVLKTIVTPSTIALTLSGQTPVLFVITTFKTSATLEANYAYSGIFEAQYADSQALEANYADSATLEVA